MKKTDKKHELDDSCIKILTVMTLYKPSTHFNELFRELKERNMELSKPTLSLHLDNLIKLNYVSRKEKEDTQFITYSLDHERISKTEEAIKRSRKIVQHLRENEKDFYSHSEEEQVGIVLAVEVHTKIELIRALIDYKLHPNDLDKIIYTNFLNSPVFQLGQKWLVKKSIEDVQYRENILKFLGEWEKRFE